MALRTVSDLVEALGGTVKVAELLGVTSPQVSNMRAEDRIPPKHYFKLRKACATANLPLPERLFAQPDAAA